MYKQLTTILGLLLTFSTSSNAQQGKFQKAIVYNEKDAFEITAPEGWVLDNKSGMQQHLPCVFVFRRLQLAEFTRSDV